MLKEKYNLIEKAKEIRLSILDMVKNSGSSHIGSAFSIVEILTSLYFEVLNIDPKNFRMHTRDRFLLSKGHGGAALYATLGHKGYFPLELLKSYAQNGSAMAGHVVKDSVPGIETTSGSLGHGLAMGIGMALALKAEKSDARVFVLVGNGECNEGTIWEGALVASQFKLDNLVVIVDHNKEQSLGSSEEIMSMEPFGEKWKAFGWSCSECDGHNFSELSESLSIGKKVSNLPKVVIAHTQKGKGVSYMEQNALAWHYKTPKDELYEQAKKELNA